jgi:hypothetical protein
LRVGFVHGKKQVKGPGCRRPKDRFLFLPLKACFLDEIDGLDFLGLAVLINLKVLKGQIIYELVSFEYADRDRNIDDLDIVGKFLRKEGNGYAKEREHRCAFKESARYEPKRKRGNKRSRF